MGNLFLLECYNFLRKLPKQFILLILSIVCKFSLQQPNLISNLPGLKNCSKKFCKILCQNNCAGVSVNKYARCMSSILKNSDASVFPWMLRNLRAVFIWHINYVNKLRNSNCTMLFRSLLKYAPTHLLMQLFFQNKILYRENQRINPLRAIPRKWPYKLFSAKADVECEVGA